MPARLIKLLFRHDDPARLILKLVFMLSVVVILFAGLQLKDFRFSDGAEVSTEHGLMATRYALATTNPFLENDIVSSLNVTGFSLSLALAPPTRTHDNFMVITSLSNGDDREQFIVGQWSHYLIILSGDDYAHQYGGERLVINTHHLPDDLWRLDLNFSPTGAVALVDGHVIASNSAFRPALPVSERHTLVTVSNTPNRRHGWMGGVQSWSLHALHLSEGGYLPSPPLVHYDFLKTPFTGESSLPLPGATLKVLPNTTIQQFQSFATSTHYFGNGIGSFIDITLNVAGFVSLGFSICTLLLLTNSRTSAIVITVFLGFMLSGFIELTQGAIPSRDSTLYDLLFNTTGTFIGAILTPFFLSILHRFTDTTSLTTRKPVINA